MNRIKQMSLVFRVIFQLLFIVAPCLVLIGWILAPEPLIFMSGIIKMNVIPKPYVSGAHGQAVLHTLSIAERSLGFCVSLIPLLVELFVLYSLINLFRLYEQGEIFSLKNVRYIINIGYALLIGQLLNPVYEFLMGLVLTWHNPPGHRFAAVVLDQTNLGILVMALLVILISWIMAEGCKLREEQQLTI